MIRTQGRLGIVLFLSSLCAQAVSFPDKPPDADFYVDKAELLDETSGTRVNHVAAQLLIDERIPRYVVTIPSLASYDASGLGIERYAQRLFDHWGIGFEERNYGILLLVSVGDRKARIELGADWARRHDDEAANVMQTLIIPAFKRDDYATGIVDGVRGLDALARGLQLPKPTPPAWFWPVVIIGGILLVTMIVNLFKSGRTGWAWALIIGIFAMLFFVLRAAASSRGGSGGGFGGGFSGGGGATGSW